jgi:hypothetical protein
MWRWKGPNMNNDSTRQTKTENRLKKGGTQDKKREKKRNNKKRGARLTSDHQTHKESNGQWRKREYSIGKGRSGMTASRHPSKDDSTSSRSRGPTVRNKVIKNNKK